jgi:hypothetical protein
MKPAVVIALALAILLTSAPAHSVERSDDGYGDVLIFPYTVANGPFVTVVSISNRGSRRDASRDDATAIRIALRYPAIDGEHAPAPKLFNVILRENDTYTFALTQAPNGTTFVSNDGSCIFGPDAGQGGAGTVIHEIPVHTAGWIEVFELGGIRRGELGDRIAGKSADCAEVAALLPSLEPSSWLSPPDNRLRGASHLVSVMAGLSFSVAPLALRDFRDAALFASPTEDTPTLADVRPARATVRLDEGTRRVSHFSARPVDAVSAVLMSTEWEMDFLIDPHMEASTDLVALMPTRAWYVEPAEPHPLLDTGTIEINALVHDREGQTTSGWMMKCTPPAPRPERLGPMLDSALGVIAFADASLLGSGRAQALTYARSHWCVQGGLAPARLPGAFDSGRVTLQFIEGPRAPISNAGFGRLVSDEGHVFHGIPVIGVGLTGVINENVAPGVIANYGIEQPIAHRSRYSAE